SRRLISSRSAFQSDVFRSDRSKQFVPGFNERLGAFALQIGGELVMVDTGLAELGDHLLRIATVDRHKLAQLAVIGESEKCRVRTCVDGERSAARRDVE